MKHGVPFFPLASPCLSKVQYLGYECKNRGMEKLTQGMKKGDDKEFHPALFMMHCVRTPISISAHSLMEL
jgi:hypothetical protein